VETVKVRLKLYWAWGSDTENKLQKDFR